MKPIFSAMATVAAVATLISCSSTPRQTGYLDAGLPSDGGQYVDLAWFDREAVARLGVVELGAVQGYRVSDVANISLDQAIGWLTEGLEAERGFPLALAGHSGGETAQLEVSITELDPGSTALRFWAGEFGAGHAWIQVEAALQDTDRGITIGRLVQRTRISGVFSLRNSRGEDSGPVLVRRILWKAGVAITRELSTALKISE